MKRNVPLPLLLLAALLFTACGRDASLMCRLEEASSLSETNADSAKILVRELREEVTGASSDVRAYYNLVLTKVTDKAHEHHAGDSVINAVREYYEERFDEEHLPEAYYYTARVNYDLDNVSRAIFFYHKALLCDSTCLTSHLRSRAYAQLGYIYLRNRLYEHAIAMQQMANDCCRQDGDTAGMRITNEDIATITQIMNVDTVKDAQVLSIEQKVHRYIERAQAQTLLRQKDRQEALSQKSADRMKRIATTLAIALLAIAALFLFRRRKATPLTGHPDGRQPAQHKFYDSELDGFLKAQLHSGKVLNHDDFSFIESRLLLTFPTFRQQLFDLYDFSEMEYHICLLIKCRQSPTNMARLLATATSTISQSRLRMQQKVFGDGGTAKDWDSYILGL